jgi:UPF0716 protein FxsA
MRMGFSGGIASGPVGTFVAIIAVVILALEIVGIYQIGQRIGLPLTLLWLIAAVVLGVNVIRRAGNDFPARMAAALQHGQAPFALLWATGRRYLAGLLLIFPGPFSDILGLLLLAWPSRLPPASPNRAPDGEGPEATVEPPPGPDRRATRRPGDGNVIEGEFRRED